MPARLVLAAIMLPVLAAASCRGDGGPSEPEGTAPPAASATTAPGDADPATAAYFEEWSRLLCDVRAEQRAFREAHAGQPASSWVREYNQIFDDYIAQVETLDPPSEATAAHARYVAASKALSEIVWLAVDGASTVEAGGEATPVPQYIAKRDAASGEAQAASEEVRAAARSAGITDELGCPDG